MRFLEVLRYLYLQLNRINMENENVNKLEKALGLARHIIGVQFIYFKKEFDFCTVCGNAENVPLG